MRTEWAYFIGGAFDLTKRPKPQTEDRYLRLAMAPPLLASAMWDNDPEIMARPVAITTETYRLMTKVPLENGDMAWIYVFMPSAR